MYPSTSVLRDRRSDSHSELSILDTLSIPPHLSLIPPSLRGSLPRRYFSRGISRKCTPVIMMDPLRNSRRVSQPFSHLSYLRELPKAVAITEQ